MTASIPHVESVLNFFPEWNFDLLGVSQIFELFHFSIDFIINLRHFFLLSNLNT